MASYTTNLNLKKPTSEESLLVADINNNMDTIDSAFTLIHGLSEASTTLVADLNDCINAGAYSIGIDTLHKPESMNYGLCFTIATDQPTSEWNGWIYQLAFHVDTERNMMFMRKNINQAGWTAWQSVAIVTSGTLTNFNTPGIYSATWGKLYIPTQLPYNTISITSIQVYVGGQWKTCPTDSTTAKTTPFAYILVSPPTGVTLDDSKMYVCSISGSVT